MDTGLLKLVRRLTEGDKIKPNKRLTAFLICLFVSSLFWFLNSLSHKYTDSVSVSVSYINLPQDKFLTNKLPESITLNIKSQGFYLLVNKMNLFKDKIVIDCNNLKFKKEGKESEALYPISSGIDKVASQLNSEIEILKIFPDTIFFYFGNKKTKVVPVKLNAMVSFEKQYQMKGEIIVRPDSVKVQGPDFLIDSLEVLETETVNLQKLNKDISVEAKILLSPRNSSLELSSKQVTANIAIEKFTEATLDIPVEISNLPDNYAIKTFPERVTITYLVAFSQFNNVDPSKFLAKADYKKINGQNRLNVEIVHQPDFVKIVKITPGKVEYIIRKK